MGSMKLPLPPAGTRGVELPRPVRPIVRRSAPALKIEIAEVVGFEMDDPRLETVTVRDGSVRITIKFVLERDIDSAAQDVREKVATAIRDLPPELLPPVITKVDPEADPVLSFALSAIVGVGLLGASLGLSLKQRGLAARIMGVGRRQSVLDTMQTAMTE